MATKQKTIRQKPIPWTDEHEETLLFYVRKNTENLTKAFALTSKQIGRSPKAIAAHWYTHTSIKTNHCLFFKMSGNSILINRSRGKGQKRSVPFYKKVLAFLGLTY